MLNTSGMSNTQFLSTAEVAELTGLHVATIGRWADSGKLAPVFKGKGLRGAYLFNREDVDALLEELQVGASK